MILQLFSKSKTNINNLYCKKINFTWHIFPGVEPANQDCSRERHSSLKDNQRRDHYKLKGTVSRNGYFFEGLNNLISTVSVCAVSLQGLSKVFHYPIQLLAFYLIL
jgi:hypothetical protein